MVLLTFAADHLVLGSARIAQRLRVGAAVVGVVVIGLGTSAPEFLVSGAAAADGNPAMAVGNLVGSNILNLTLVLGVAALIRHVTVTAAVISREAMLAVAAVVLFAVLAGTGLHRWTGLILAVAGAATLALLVRWARTDRKNRTLAEQSAEFTADPVSGNVAGPHRIWFEAFRATAGLAGVLAGAQLLVANAAAIATDLGVSQLVIGFTLVALGTSVPELITTIQAQRRGETDLLVGNLFGSNLFNSTIGGGIVGLCTGDASARAGLVVLVAMTAVTVLAWGLLRRVLRIGKVESMLLLAGYLAALPLVLSS
ncbi:calcium/sodium antiporter [Nocardia thraciensis]